MSGPTPSSNPFNNPKIAPRGTNHFTESNLAGLRLRRRQATVKSKNAPKLRIKTTGEVATKSIAPVNAEGTEPRENQPTAGAEISRRLNQTRPRLEERFAIVRIGIASRTPKYKTSTGKRRAVPPDPAIEPSSDAKKAAAPKTSKSNKPKLSKK